jgi:hypothetical protein
VPSSSAIQPDSRSEPTLVARVNLFPAICDEAASYRKGASFLPRAAIDIGLVPNLSSAENVGSTPDPAEVAHIPTMSCFAACMEKCPTAPRWAPLFIVTMPTPTVLAFLTAMSIARVPRMMPRPLSALMTAVPGVSRSICQSGLALIWPLVYCSTYTRSILETPWVSTPRRSVMVSTSAPSLASSGDTPIFSKTAATTSSSDSADTRSVSPAFGLNRSSMRCFSPTPYRNGVSLVAVVEAPLVRAA